MAAGSGAVSWPAGNLGCQLTMHRRRGIDEGFSFRISIERVGTRQHDKLLFGNFARDCHLLTFESQFSFSELNTVAERPNQGITSNVSTQDEPECDVCAVGGLFPRY